MGYLPAHKSTNPRTVTRRRAVRWLSVWQLAQTAIEVVRVTSFTRLADKRETMATDPREFYSMQPAEGVVPDAFWLDYTADTGDGFDATLTVANLLAGSSSVDWTPADVPAPPAKGSWPRPMADLVVLGGDEVYPVATEKNYESRFWQVFGYARRWASGVEDHNASYNTTPRMAVLPGNHDWYDGLVTFRQLFTQSWVNRGDRKPLDGLVRVGDQTDDALEPESIGGWGTFQSRSYFAVHLWGDWWMWGLDSQLNRDIDAHQLDYFTQAAQVLGDTGQVILCTATPAWLEADIRNPSRDDSEPTLGTMLWFIFRTLGADRREQVRLILTGDKHHYVRYEASTDSAPGPPLVTCGGGGAFLSSTHNLPAQLNLRWRRWNSREPVESIYAVARTPDNKPAMFPDRGESRGNASRFKWLAVAWRNGPLLPLLIALLGWSCASSLTRLGLEPIANNGAFGMPLGWAWALLALFVVAMGALAAKGSNDAVWPAVSEKSRQKARQGAALLILMVIHTALQLLAMLVTVLIAGAVTNSRSLDTILCIALQAIFGTVAFAAYLHLADLMGLHDLESYSAMGLTGHKSIVRLRIARDGVTAYVWGVRETPRYGRTATPPQRMIKAELVDSFRVSAHPATQTPAAQEDVGIATVVGCSPLMHRTKSAPNRANSSTPDVSS